MTPTPHSTAGAAIVSLFEQFPTCREGMLDDICNADKRATTLVVAEMAAYVTVEQAAQWGNTTCQSKDVQRSPIRRQPRGF